MKKTLRILSLSLVVSSSFAFGAFATEKPLPDFSKANPVAVRQLDNREIALKLAGQRLLREIINGNLKRNMGDLKGKKKRIAIMKASKSVPPKATFFVGRMLERGHLLTEDERILLVRLDRAGLLDEIFESIR